MKDYTKERKKERKNETREDASSYFTGDTAFKEFFFFFTLSYLSLAAHVIPSRPSPIPFQTKKRTPPGSLGVVFLPGQTYNVTARPLIEALCSRTGLHTH